MKVEARGVKRPVIGVAVGGFEIACGMKLWGVPEAAPKVRQKRELRP